MKLAIAQLNPTVGDIDGNAAQVRAAWTKAREGEARSVDRGLGDAAVEADPAADEAES